MGTETALEALVSTPTALMRAAQAIIDRRNSMAADAAAAGPAGGGGPASTRSDASFFATGAPRDPNP